MLGNLAMQLSGNFNHNSLCGDSWPSYFNLRHYPMRSREQMNARLHKDRLGIRRGQLNRHYDHMVEHPERLEILPEQLHFDDGRAELNPIVVFDWQTIYGAPRD
jgi:hypothetical protein